MSEGFSVPVPEEQKEILKVKEDHIWEQKSSQPENYCLTQEIFGQCFSQFCYQKTIGPREALSQLWVLCYQRPTKEQIMELLVLKQILTLLPHELGLPEEAFPTIREEVIIILKELEQLLNESGP